MQAIKKRKQSDSFGSLNVFIYRLKDGDYFVKTRSSDTYGKRKGKIFRYWTLLEPDEIIQEYSKRVINRD